MGCDITMHSQVKREGKWVWHDLDIFDERNYTLFGILDGTRGTEFEPIAPHKGFPKDSEDKLKPGDDWNDDYHTDDGVYLGYAGVSYLNLTELKSFDWTQKIPSSNYTMEESAFVKEVLPYFEICEKTMEVRIT